MGENKTNFDLFTHDYEAIHAENTKLSGFPTSHFDEYKIKEVAGFLRKAGLADKKINFLNFGCGIGKSEKYIRAYLPRAIVYSTDTSEKSLERAHAENKNLKNIFFERCDGRRVPFDVSFDVVFLANVFHHIPRETHLDALREIHRTMAPGAFLFFFEHNPWNPVTVKTIKACPFDEGAELLSPIYAGRLLKRSGFDWRRLRFTLFFPKFLSIFIPLEKFFRKIPLGAQYYFVARKSM